MPSLIRKKIKCEVCGTQTTRNNFIRQRCSAGLFACPSCTNFSTMFRADMNYQTANKHSNATVRVVHKCKTCDKDFHSFYILREHARKELRAHRGSGAQKVDVPHVIGDVSDNSLKEDLETCRHFLVDSEMENGRHSVYNFVMDTLDPKISVGITWCCVGRSQMCS